MSYTLDSNDGGLDLNGEYTLNISVEGNSSNYDSVQVKIDNSAPSVTVNNLEDEARISSGFGPVEFDVSDEFSGVSNLSMRVVQGDSVVSENSLSCSEKSCEKSVSFPSDGLTSGEDYTLEIYAQDAQGNSGTTSVSFTYDDSYQGDTSPEINTNKPGVYKVEPNAENFMIPVTLSNSSEDSPIRLLCFFNDGNYRFAATSYASIDEGDYTFQCDLDPTTRAEMKFDVSLLLQDKAGNTHPAEVGTYYFDMNPPTIANLSAIVGVFNSDFQVSYDAHDTKDVEGLKVSKIHYQVGDDELDLSSGTNVSEVDGDFKVSTEGLSTGQHTVYAWAIDKAGRTSESASFDFDFRPNAEPEAAIGSVSSLSVPAGDSKAVSVNVTNTGELFISKMELKLSSDIYNSSRTLEGLKPGDTVSSLFSIDTEPSDLGVHTLEFSTESPDVSKTVRLTVEANKQQEQKITSRYQEYLEKYNALKENVSSLKPQLEGFRKETLTENTSEFFSDFEAAKRAKESGDLYKVESHLENISSDFQTASSTYEQVSQAHAKAERNELIGMLLLLFVGLGGSGLAYVAFFSEQYYLDLEALQEEYEFLEKPVQAVQETMAKYELSLGPLENAVEKVGELLAEEEEEIEEAEEQAFQGFT